MLGTAIISHTSLLTSSVISENIPPCIVDSKQLQKFSSLNNTVVVQGGVIPSNISKCAYEALMSMNGGGGSGSTNERKPVGTFAFHLTVLLLMMIIILIGSSLMIVTIAMHSHLRTITNYFIVALSVSDLFTAVLVIPINLAFPTALFYGYTTCMYAACLTMVVCLSSIANIMAVAVDRYEYNYITNKNILFIDL